MGFDKSFEIFCVAEFVGRRSGRLSHTWKFRECGEEMLSRRDVIYMYSEAPRLPSRALIQRHETANVALGRSARTSLESFNEHIAIYEIECILRHLFCSPRIPIIDIWIFHSPSRSLRE